MSIWKKTVSPELIHEHTKNTAIDHLGIKMTDHGDDFLVCEMPVDDRTRQSYGVLHGGASVLLAESVGSIAASLCVDDDCKVVGLEINANHLSGVTDGTVVAVATPAHLGRSTQVWEIKIHHKETGKAVCLSRFTVAVLNMAV